MHTSDYNTPRNTGSGSQNIIHLGELSPQHGPRLRFKELLQEASDQDLFEALIFLDEQYAMDEYEESQLLISACQLPEDFTVPLIANEISHRCERLLEETSAQDMAALLLEVLEASIERGTISSLQAKPVREAIHKGFEQGKERCSALFASCLGHKAESKEGRLALSLSLMRQKYSSDD